MNNPTLASCILNVDITQHALASAKKSMAISYCKQARLRYENGDYEGAIHDYRAALDMGMNSSGLHYALGIALSIKAQKNFANLGLARKCLAESMAELQTAITLKPDFPAAHLWLGCLCLLVGDLGQGWRHYDWRFAAGLIPRPGDPELPLWGGELLAGSTILLNAEQGLGDTILCIRYVELVAQRGGRIVIAAPERLRRLFESMPHVSRVITPDEPCPDATCKCAVMSLPAIFGTELATVPSKVPYLEADPREVQAWSQRLSPKHLNVGLVWAGRPGLEYDTYRSTSLNMLEPLTHIEGISLFSLQRGDAAQQLDQSPLKAKIQDLEQWCSDMNDSAAAIAALDVVVTVDTSIAHLTGALAKPVWIMLPFLPDWRWLLQGTSSPWYPTARLFRQSTPGDWPGVVQNVARELQLASRWKRENTLKSPHLTPQPPARSFREAADEGALLPLSGLNI